MNWKKILILIFAFNAFNTIGASLDYKNRKIVQSVRVNELVTRLRQITSLSSPNLFIGGEGHQKIRKYLKQDLESMANGKTSMFKEMPFKANVEQAKKVYLDDFQSNVVGKLPEQSDDYKKWNSHKNYMLSIIDEYKNFVGINYEFIVKGSTGKKLYIISHYDNVAHDKENLKIKKDQVMPGADYNSSSLAIMLEMIKAIYKEQLQVSLHFVFLDNQSLGFQGSYAHAQELEDKENIIGVINLEMLGYDSKSRDKTQKYLNFKSYGRKGSTEDKDLFKSLDKSQKKSSSQMDFIYLDNSFNSSDSFRYWDAQIPAITMTQDWENDFNPNYQTKNDFVEAINQKSYYEAYKYIAFSTFALVL